MKNEAVSSRRFVIPKNSFREVGPCEFAAHVVFALPQHGAINSSAKVTAIVRARRALTIARETSGGEQLSCIFFSSAGTQTFHAAAGSWWRLLRAFFLFFSFCASQFCSSFSSLPLWTGCIRLFVRHLRRLLCRRGHSLPLAPNQNRVGDAVNKSAASPSVEALRNIRGGPGVSDVSDCISSSGQPSIWLGVCRPDPEPAAAEVSQGPAEAKGGCGGGLSY